MISKFFTRRIRQAEVGAARTMIQRVMVRFGLNTERLAGDTAHDHNEDAYICPAGKIPRPRRREITTKPVHVDKYGMQKYRASKSDCSVCPLKSRCCPKTPMHIALRSVHEEARDMARAIAKTDASDASRRDRKKVEMLFVRLKQILRLGRLRGPSGANDEFLLIATAHKPLKVRQNQAKNPIRCSLGVTAKES